MDESEVDSATVWFGGVFGNECALDLTISPNSIAIPALPTGEDQWAIDNDVSINMTNTGDIPIEFFLNLVGTYGEYPFVEPYGGRFLVNQYEWPVGLGGNIIRDSSVVVPLNFDSTTTDLNGLAPGNWEARMYITRKTQDGENSDTLLYLNDVTYRADTVDITLMLLNEGTQYVDTTVIISTGGSDLIEFVDGYGHPTGLGLEFSIVTESGSVTVESITKQPPLSGTPSIEDPNGLITEPVFPTKYFEISTDMDSLFYVDVGLDYDILPGINDPQALRLARRPLYSGPSIPWEMVPISQTQLDLDEGRLMAKNQTSFSQWALASNSSDNSLWTTRDLSYRTLSLSRASRVVTRTLWSQRVSLMVLGSITVRYFCIIRLLVRVIIHPPQ